MIKNYYDFYGYLKFANHVKSLIKNGIGNLNDSNDEIESEADDLLDFTQSNPFGNV